MQNLFSKSLSLSRLAVHDSAFLSQTTRPHYLATITQKISYSFSFGYKQDPFNSNQKPPTSRFLGKPNAMKRPAPENSQNENLIRGYKIGASRFFGSFAIRPKTLSPPDLQGYLNHVNQILLKFRELAPKEKDRLRKELKEAVQEDHTVVANSLAQLKVNRNRVFNYPVLFKYLSFCFSQGLHSADMCNNIVKQLASPDIIFQVNETKRFSVLLLYFTNYAPEYLSSEPFQRLQQFFQANFQTIVQSSTKEDILSIIEALSHQDILNDRLKALLAAEAYKRVESENYSHGQKLKLFTFLCRGNIFANNRVYLSLLEKEVLDINLLKVDRDSMVKALFYMRSITIYSPQLKSKLLDFMMEHHDHLGESTLMPLLSYLEELNVSGNFLAFLNKYIRSTYQKKNFSISVLTLFMYKLAKLGGSSEEVFRDLEKHIIENIEKYQWNLIDLKLLLTGCRLSGFPNSLLYSKLESEIMRSLQDARIDPESFGNLVFETASSAHLPSFDFFKVILERMAESVQLSKGRDLMDTTKIMRSISAFIVKYEKLAGKEYQEHYKPVIQEELDKILPHWVPCTQEILKEKDSSMRHRLFQFLLTVHIEFPELLKKHYGDFDVLKCLKEYKNADASTASDFSSDIAKVLDRLQIDYELEHRVYVYDIDIFIKPKIAVQAEGRHHYTKALTESHRDMLRDFHLEKLGYKVVKIPAFDYYNILPSQVELQEEYIKEKIFEEKPLSSSIEGGDANMI